MSAPHIYHSALPQSPKTSIVWSLYGQYANPLVRVVQGTPMSWDPAIKTTKIHGEIRHIVWSPCSRFLVVDSEFGHRANIQTLDRATLNKLKSLESQKDRTRVLTFSADGSLLMRVDKNLKFISWDLQTGVQHNVIHLSGTPNNDYPWSVTFSEGGTALGVLFESGKIGTYGISGRLTHLRQIKGSVIHEIWTHGEDVQFATLEPGFITIWAIGFTSKHPPVKVKSLSTPNSFNPKKKYLFLPTLSQLAFFLEETVLVWDACHGKFLLNSMGIKNPLGMTFSSDGCFFACGTHSGEIFLWKESSTGYALHKKFTSSPARDCAPGKLLLSPNGQSIITFDEQTIQLYHTTDSATSLSSVPTQHPQHTNQLILGFSPDQSLAVVAWWGDNIVTVFNLKSGNPQLIIDTGMKAHGVGVSETATVVVGEGQIVTWNLPAEDGIHVTRVNVNDSVQTTTLQADFHTLSKYPGSVSPDLKYVVVTAYAQGGSILELFNTSTGELITAVKPRENGWLAPLFSLDGSELWCPARQNGVEGWELGNNKELKPKPLAPNAWRKSEGCPWNPPHGYRVMDSGWILNSSGKKLVWLHPHWRADMEFRVWCGNYLALLRSGLAEPCIMELLEE